MEEGEMEEVARGAGVVICTRRGSSGEETLLLLHTMVLGHIGRGAKRECGT